ncbi:hypothetical protein ACFL5V_10885 [Fibrobacterota bacterium]
MRLLFGYLRVHDVCDKISERKLLAAADPHVGRMASQVPEEAAEYVSCAGMRPRLFSLGLSGAYQLHHINSLLERVWDCGEINRSF